MEKGITTITSLLSLNSTVPKCCGCKLPASLLIPHCNLSRWTELSCDCFFFLFNRTVMRKQMNGIIGGRQVALDRRGQGLVTFAWPHSNCCAFIGICGSRPASFWLPFHDDPQHSHARLFLHRLCQHVCCTTRPSCMDSPAVQRFFVFFF